MNNSKATFITIIVLLCIFAPLTILGLFQEDSKSILEENSNHETFYKGYIWFYDENNNFLSKYECATEICDFTTPTIDDSAYGINYYKNGQLKKVPVLDNKFTFITDGALIYLYSITNGNTLKNFKAIKNYNTNLDNNTYILKDSNDIWGVIAVNETLSPILPFEYDFIGLGNYLNDDGTLKTDKYIVSKNSKWYIVDNTGNAITGYIDDPIVEYTNDYIFSKNTERVRIYSYENYEYLSNYKIKDYLFADKYIGIVTENFLLIYENLGTSYLKSIALTNVVGKISVEKNGNKLDVKANNELIESVELK